MNTFVLHHPIYNLPLKTYFGKSLCQLLTARLPCRLNVLQLMNFHHSYKKIKINTFTEKIGSSCLGVSWDTDTVLILLCYKVKETTGHFAL